ncbi:serine/threonine protein kinase [Gemmatimonadota bacterium]
MEGRIINQYRILEKLGSGGMGEVWLAEDTRLERKVALKFLPHHAAAEESEKARFMQEAKAAARLSHANIAQVFEIGEEAGRLYIVMEYINGGSLRDRLEQADKRSIPIEKIYSWIRQTARGLAEAHRQGIVHRDIKPDNLMLTGSDQIKITDFGLAKLETSTRLTAEGATLGTVNYMSPEQVTGRDVDHRADLFSLGATFFELLTGESAFPGPDAGAIYYAILNRETEPITRYRKDAPEACEAILQKLLEKDPGLRYQSAEEVLTDFRRLEKSSSTVEISLSVTSIARRIIRSVPKAMWIVGAALLAATVLMKTPGIREYRNYLRSVSQSKDWLAFDRYEYSVIRELLQLADRGDLDAYIAVAVIEGEYRNRYEVLQEGIERYPRNASLQGLRSLLRYRDYSIKDPEGREATSTAIQLDPENGAWSFLGFLGAVADEEPIEAEALLSRTLMAPEFSMGVSDHFASVHRCLLSLGELTASWPRMLDSYVSYLSSLNVSVHTYLGGRNRADLRSAFWRENWQSLDSAAKIDRLQQVQHLAFRLINDKTAIYEQSNEGLALANTVIDSQLAIIGSTGDDYFNLRELKAALTSLREEADTQRNTSGQLMNQQLMIGWGADILLRGGTVLLLLTLGLWLIYSLASAFLAGRVSGLFGVWTRGQNLLRVFLAGCLVLPVYAQPEDTLGDFTRLIAFSIHALILIPSFYLIWKRTRPDRSSLRERIRFERRPTDDRPPVTLKGMLYLLLPLAAIFMLSGIVLASTEVFRLKPMELPPLIAGIIMVGTIGILFPIILTVQGRIGASFQTHPLWRGLIYAESMLLIATMLMIAVAAILFGPSMSELLADPDFSVIRNFTQF